MNSIVRVMKPEEMHLAVEFAALEGWNPGINDGNCFYNTDPNGFFVAEKDNEIVGCISAIAYSESYGFIGFYIVKPKYRVDIYGKLLAIAAKKYLKTQNIGLDGVIERQENYARLGFKFAHRNIRFEFTGLAQASDDLTIIDTNLFPLVYDYDTDKFPAPRQQFLQMWLTMPNSLSLAKTENGKLLGWGMIRNCRKGYKIGPLFADNAIVADEILSTLLSKSNQSQVYFDIPEINQNALKLAEKYSMVKVFETARMYSQYTPDIGINKIYGITSFELG
jgi:hypothetical protein